MGFSKHSVTSCYRPLFYLIIVLCLASCGVGRNVITQPSAGLSAKQQDLVAFSKQFLRTPYRFGGRGPNAFDCSGFTMFVFREFGYTLNPSSATQDQQFPTISNKRDLRVGDLVFFEGRTRNRRVGHVGIVTETRPGGDFRFIHASVTAGVIVSSSTEPYWSVRYLRGGRVLQDDPHYVSRPRTRTNNARTTAARSTENRRTRSGNNNQNSAFTPAPAAHREPVTPRVATVSPQQNETVFAANESNVLVQTNPLKNPALANHRTPENNSNRSDNEVVSNVNTEVIRREDQAVPAPVRANEGQGTHTVRPGETLFSISRQHNITVEQIRQWNPQMGNVLRAGEVLRIR
jgi:LysM repeat protein